MRSGVSHALVELTCCEQSDGTVFLCRGAEEVWERGVTSELKCGTGA